jgi:GT2 family glycosyltransferase
MQKHMEEQSPPRVTALIVSRNGPAELRRCLESLEKSEGRDRLEILIVDDGSRDETARVPDEFPEVISLSLPKRMGWTRAVNIGLRTAKGDLVLLLPQWVEVEPDTVERLADRLESSPDVGGVCPRTDKVWPFPSPEALQEAWRTGQLPGAKSVTEREMSTDYPQGAPIMMRRELFRAMNYLNEGFGDRWADLQLCSRIRDGGKSILELSDIQVREGTGPTKDVSLLEWTDSANGVATWIGLHYGFAAGLKARVSMAFHALGRGKTSAFMGILTGSKIDGNQE